LRKATVKRLKRSKRVRLILLGGLSAGALAGCSPGNNPPITSDNVYANNCYVPGVGYYHAPFCAWFALPYNHYDSRRQQFFYGGQWGPFPLDSITNLSSPSPQVAAHAEAVRTDIVRGGFGGTGGGHFWGGG
jgi:hypothetical protein